VRPGDEFIRADPILPPTRPYRPSIAHTEGRRRLRSILPVLSDEPRARLADRGLLAAKGEHSVETLLPSGSERVMSTALG
jgi:hypothetical protein